MTESNSPHRALVFGATGYTGSYLVRRLKSCGIDTWAHLRPSSSKRATFEASCRELGVHTLLEPWETSGLEGLVSAVQPTLVFAVLGTTRSRMKALKRQGAEAGSGSYEAVDYGLTAMAHRACEAMDEPPRFIYLSSMGVKESTRLPYLSVRWKMEQEIRNGRCDWTIVRPGFITGSDREEFRFGERAGAIVSDGVLALTGLLGGKRLRQAYRSISGDELAEAMIRWALAETGNRRTVETIDLWEGP